MKPSFRRAALALALSAAAAVPLAAHAHRSWLLPSATVLSGEDPWVTVDAAVSNDLFYFEHFALRGADATTVTAPDGKPAKIENYASGRYRSTFDVHLTEKGTYKLALAGTTVMASYKDAKGELKRFRGTPEAFAKEVPANAPELAVAENASRLEVFVTSGKPTTTVLRPTGKGLELVPITHPNDLFAGDTARFAFLIDGKPAAGLKVSVIPGGIRYRDQLGEIEVVTDKDGRFAVKWPAPGMYWLNASYPPAPERAEGGPGGVPQPGAPGSAGGPAGPGGAGGPGAAAAGGPGGPAGPVRPGKRASYTATLEVLQP